VTHRQRSDTPLAYEYEMRKRLPCGDTPLRKRKWRTHSRLLKTGRTLPGVGRLSRVFREIDCHRGRPDFIALGRGSTRFLTGKSITLKFAGSLVMSFLHGRAPRSVGYQCRHSGLSLRTVKAAVDELVKRKYALRTGNWSYLTNPAHPLPAGSGMGI
jgi:hypothetical protein